MEGEEWIEVGDYDLRDKAVLEGLLAHTNPHILPICLRRERTLQAHALLHAIGAQDTPEHDLSLNLLEAQEGLLRRAFDALWC